MVVMTPCKGINYVTSLNRPFGIKSPNGIWNSGTPNLHFIAVLNNYYYIDSLMNHKAL